MSRKLSFFVDLYLVLRGISDTRRIQTEEKAPGFRTYNIRF